MSGNNIISIESPIAHNEEFESICKSLSILDWDMRVQKIARSMGIYSDESLSDSEGIIENSLASRLGHKRVYDFITKSETFNGLGLNWESWERDANAYFLQKKYNISGVNPRDIIDQFNDVKAVLGRVPSSPFEYQSTKDEVLKKQRDYDKANHETYKASKNSEIKNLLSRIESKDN